MDKLAKLQSEVFGKQRVLAEIQKQYGTFSLYDYVNSWPTSLPEQSTLQLTQTVRRLLTNLYGPKIAQEAAEQLTGLPLVSTIDHHGILNHPFFVNSNLIFSQKNHLRFLVCLSTAGVSLNNSSWPGCLIYTNNSGRQKRLSFFPDKLKTGTVLTTRAIALADTQKVLRHINTDSDLSAQNKNQLRELADSLFTSEIYDLPDFSTQACRLSLKLWSAVFPSAPTLVYLPIERLVTELIISQIIPNPDHILHQLFFTGSGRELINKHFSGSLGAFSSEHKGSFLFWGVGGKSRRIHLYKDKETLTDGQGLVFNLAPDAVMRALLQNRLYPTSLVCFLTLLSFNLTCAGGFNQVNWLSGIKEKFLKLLRKNGQTTLAGQVETVPTKNFAEGNLAFLPGKNGLTKATGLDLFLSGRDYFPEAKRLAEQITLQESLASLLPEIYRVITPAKKRHSNLLSLTDKQIMAAISLDQKITSLLLTDY